MMKIKLIVGFEPRREGEYPTVYEVGSLGVTAILKGGPDNDDFRIFKGKHLHAEMYRHGVTEVVYFAPEETNPRNG